MFQHIGTILYVHFRNSRSREGNHFRVRCSPPPQEIAPCCTVCVKLSGFYPCSNKSLMMSAYPQNAAMQRGVNPSDDC